MALSSNFGTQVYLISCFVPSAPGVNITRNFSTNYFLQSATNYILFGVSTTLTQPVSNAGTKFYAPPCTATSTPGINLNKNGGTQFYFSTAFNCVTFCDPVVIFKNTNLNH